MRKRKPILVLDNTFTFGGAINSLGHLFRALDKTKFIPVLVTGQSQEFLKTHFSECISYHYLPKLPWVDNRRYKKIASFSIFKVTFFRRLLNLGRYFYWVVFVTLPEALKYYRLGRKHAVVLVHLNNILGSQLAGILAAKMLGVPCIAHLRDFEQVDVMTSLYARMIDFHIAISNTIRDNLLQLAVPAEKIAVVYDAIDLDEFDEAVTIEPLYQEFGLIGDEPLFGLFGRIIPWKGTLEFVHAAARVLQCHPAAKAFVVGDCSDGDSVYLQEVRELISQYGLQESLVLTGYRTDVPALMRLMDVVAHASITPEPFGMVLIEGMAMGKPVVATRMGGPLDIIEDGKTGYLVAPGKPEEMATAISRLLGDRQLAAEMGTRGKLRVRQLFTKERYAREVESIYAKFLTAL